MTVEEDQVKPVSTEVTSAPDQEQGDNKATVQVSKVLLETAIVDDTDEQVQDNINSTAKSPEANSRMNDVPVEFVSGYNTICADQSGRGKPASLSGKLSSPKVQEALTSLYSDACTMWSYAPEYDYSPQVPYNGFRSFLRVVFAYFDRLSLAVRLIQLEETSAKDKETLIDRINDYVDFLPLLTHQLEALKLIRKETCQQSGTNSPASNNETGDLAVTQVQDKSLSTELMIVHNEMKMTPKDMVIFFKKSIFAFWLPLSIRKAILKMRKGSVCLNYPWTQGLSALFSEKKRSKLMADYSVYWSYADMKSVFKWMPTPKLTPDATATKFNLEKRQENWIVVKEVSSVLEKDNASSDSCLCGSKNPVRLIIIKPKLKQTDRVILQIHGGGWAVGSAELSYTWINPWVKEIGATIVAIDYSLAPANKYPIALQEVLDTYLWLSDASKKATVLEPLGFVPQDIVVTGDSAGGNLTMALAILLAEITQKSSDPPKLPRALVPMYPAASPGMPFITASSTLFDALLAPLQRSKMGIYYMCEDPADPKISYLNGRNNPWFTDQVKYKDAYTKLNGHKRGDPLFHLVTYQSYHLLKQVPLYIQAAEFDPLLDDAVDLAKVWKGEVIFDVMPNAIHGYLMFDEMSPECRRASETSCARLKQAIGK